MESPKLNTAQPSWASHVCSTSSIVYSLICGAVCHAPAHVSGADFFVLLGDDIELHTQVWSKPVQIYHLLVWLCRAASWTINPKCLQPRFHASGLEG